LPGPSRGRSILEAANASLIENVAYAYVYDEEIGQYVAAGLPEPWNGYFVNNSGRS
jgi:hypothetical protein